MRIIDRLIDIVELFIIALFVYWFMVLISKGPEAARQFAEGVAKWIGETAERIREAVEEVAEKAEKSVEEGVKWIASELDEKVRKCIGYIHEAYNIPMSARYVYGTHVKAFCIALAEAEKAGVITEDDAYTLLRTYYEYYKQMGYSDREALIKALDDMARKLEKMAAEENLK